VNIYIVKAEKIKLSTKINNQKIKTPINNYFKMIKKDREEIININRSIKKGGGTKK
jgi:ribosomal protein L13